MRRVPRGPDLQTLEKSPSLALQVSMTDARACRARGTGFERLRIPHILDSSNRPLAIGHT